MERVAVLTYDLVICKDSNDCLCFWHFLLNNNIMRSNIKTFCSSLLESYNESDLGTVGVPITRWNYITKVYRI